MSRLLSTLLFASLLPACMTEALDGTEPDTSEHDQEIVTRGLATRLVPVGDTINAYGVRSSLRARLIDGNGNGLAGRSVGAHIGTRSFYGVTDATGVVDIERSFEVLGVPTQHVVTWKFNGADIYAASTASSKLTVIKSDCQMSVRSRFYNGKQLTDATWQRRTGANEWSTSYQDVEITNNGTSLGTYNTNDIWGLESTPIANAGTVGAMFHGNEYYQPCAASAPYLLVEPVGKIAVSTNVDTATIGASSVTVSIQTLLVNGIGYTPRPNTSVRVWAMTEDIYYNEVSILLGNVTTDSSGYATFTFPVDASFHQNRWDIAVHSDDPFDYQDRSYADYPSVFVKKGTVEMTRTILDQKVDAATGYTIRTSKWTARNAANKLPLGKLPLKGPCNNMVTDSYGSYTCTYAFNLWGELVAKAAQGDRWQTVYP